MPRVLLVDDEPNILKSLSGALSRDGYEVLTADTLESARAHMGTAFDVALLDVLLPDGSGMDLLSELVALQPHCVSIMISGHAQLSDAVLATRRGAFDFLEKPLSLEKLLVTMQNGLELERLRVENLRLQEGEDDRYIIKGKSAVILDLLSVIEKVADSDVRIMIRGENGTGKELVARLIHRKSARASGPYVPLNCAALPENLIESELFGYEKGAFTGASRTHPGKFEEASGGTLFLDEVGDMPAAAQAKLLRVLEEQQVQRLGSTKLISVDVRIIAATNRNLEAMVEEGTFREDLMFRLNVVPLVVPPLRERTGDIPLLAEYFLARVANTSRPKRLSDSALKLLAAYSFPGNVRELRNMAERMSILVDSTEVGAAHLKQLFPELTSGRNQQIAPHSKQMEQAEKAILVSTLVTTGWNVSKAAELLGLERSHLHKKMKSLNIERPA